MGLTRRFLFNEVSWDGTCTSLQEFRANLKFCLDCLRFLRRHGAGLEVGRTFFSRPLAFAENVRSALCQLDPEQRRLVSLWVDRDGPFWDRPAQHSEDEYFECQTTVVTETALAEAAHMVQLGEQPIVVSLPNGRFVGPTVSVIWCEGPYGTTELLITHADSISRVEELAGTCLSGFRTYREFVEWASKAFPSLLIDCETMIEQMGNSVVPAIMDRGRELLAALNSIAEALVAGDTERYGLLCQEWLRSERFSDSSKSEKDDKVFTQRMTFEHPDTGSKLVCYWHGKVRTGVYRLHFEWPPPLASKRLFVAYFGPKLTKQ